MDGSPHNPGETMENQTSFDLNAAIQRWRAELAKSSSFKKDDLDELEAHVRDSTETLRAPSLSEEEAFLIATRRTGQQDQLAAEFATVNGSSVWLDRIRWITIGWIGGPVLFGLVGIVSLALLPVSETPIVFPPISMIEVASALVPFGTLPLLLLIALRSNPLRKRRSAVLALTAGLSLLALTIARTFPIGDLLAPVTTPVALTLAIIIGVQLTRLRSQFKVILGLVGCIAILILLFLAAGTVFSLRFMNSTFVASLAGASFIVFEALRGLRRSGA
jgi:hypothetical protein